MPRFDLKCDACGKVTPDAWIHTFVPPCECGGSNRKLFSFFPSWNEATIRQVSERMPAYHAWLNSDKVKDDVRAGRLRPVGKHEDQAHGGGAEPGIPYETPVEKQKRWESHEREFIAAGCPDIPTQQKMAAEGKL